MQLFKKFPWLIVVLGLVLPLAALEIWVNRHLFDYTSYTNSENMDPQMAFFAARKDWNLVVLGSSEVKWGIDPSQIDRAVAARGVKSEGFNLGFDGFNENFYLSILPSLKLPERLPKLKVVLIGINLVEEKQILPSSFKDGFPCDGILQRAVLKSDFAKDYDLEHFCTPSNWAQPLVKEAEKVSAIVRYRRSLRTLLLNARSSKDSIGAISNGIKQYPNGFHSHTTAKDNWKSFQDDYRRFLDEKKNNPQNFAPMKSGTWAKLLEKDGFFDRWADYFLEAKILPVFFALPTNPLLINSKNRREDYRHNSQLMAKWAKQRQVVYLDLGIRDRQGDNINYSDHRHLSGIGAVEYSRELGAVLARNPKVLAALANRRGSQNKHN